MDITSKGIRYNDIDSDEWKVCQTNDYVYNLTGDLYTRNEDGTWHNIPTGEFSDPIPGFQVEICARRFSIYYIYNFLVPVMIVSAMGFFSVFLPSNSGDKINLTITVLLGFFFVQGIIASLVPKAETTPLLAHYVLFALLLSALNLAFSGAVFCIHNIPPKIPIPTWIEFLGFRILSHLVCMRMSVFRTGNLFNRKATKNSITSTHKMTTKEKMSKKKIEEIELKEMDHGDMEQEEELKSTEENERTHNWEELAKILDRFCSALYTLASIANVIIFLTPLVLGREPCK